MSVEAIIDDFLIYAPSFLLGDLLEEGKSVGTAQHHDLALIHHLLHGHTADKDPEGYGIKLKQGVTVGKRKLEELESRVLKTLSALIVNQRAGKLSPESFRLKVTATMKEAWKDAFMAGVRSSGVAGKEQGKGKVVVPSVMPTMDDAWLRSAIQHEMRFLNKFMDDVVNDSGRMPVLQRARMYVDALKSFYDSARVIGLPDNVLLWWSGPHDKRSCAGCAYLFSHNPYTKRTLPTTPRSGATPCLTNCRDRIVVRRAPADKVKEVEAGLSREAHIKALRRIKSGKPYLA